MLLSIWMSAVSSVLLLLCLVVVAARTAFTPTGEPCIFPFTHQGRDFDTCVETAPGLNFCKSYGDGWGQCMELSSPTTPSTRKVVPQLLPLAELATERSNFTETQTVDLTTVYYGECCAVLAELGFQSSLPVVIIETNGREIPDEPKTDATMCTCGSQSGEYDGPIGIEIRGSTSARDFAKKSFAFETRSTDGDSVDVSLLGLPDENDWILYGPETDKTMGLRNVISYTLARASGRYASRLKYCEVFLTTSRSKLKVADYNGIYLLAENVKRGANRVRLQKQSEKTLDAGYIVKHDNDNDDPGDDVFATRASSLPMIMVYPKKATPDQIAFVKESVDAFEAALSSNTFKDKKKGYQSFIDVDSFVDYFLLSEVTKNPDSYRGSAFFHKDTGGPIVMGPVWDYNEAFGICCGFPIEGYQRSGQSSGRSGGSAISPEGWRFNICVDRGRCRVDPLDGTSLWYRRLWQDVNFRKRVQTRWTLLRAGAWSDGNIQSIFDDIQSNIGEPVRRNYVIWADVLKGRSAMPSLEFWQQEIDVLHKWLFDHLAWLDTQLIKNTTLYEQLTSSPPASNRSIDAGR